jgi:DNA ligase (NAD+)
LKKESLQIKPIELYLHTALNARPALIRKEGEANHYCPNEKGCPPQIKGKVEHFIQRKAMDIDSMGEQTIRQLFDLGFVKSPADLFYLNQRTITSNLIR